MNYTNLQQNIENITNFSFEEVAMRVFFYQAEHNALYRRYLSLLGKNPKTIQSTNEIPFLPISLFKNHTIQSETWQPQEVFTSSGTTGGTTSQHFLRDRAFYTKNAIRGFEHFYRPIEDYCILALLPAYLERKGSSLVFMVQQFIERSKYQESGFFLDNLVDLTKILQKCEQEKRPTLLIGVSFALLDLAEQYPQSLKNTIIMETGGMKGRRAELTRSELHYIFSKAFNNPIIHSEYGMTELLSQAYSQGEGIFRPAPTLSVQIREATDPFSILPFGKAGGINLIDLANLATCSFIATDDLGRSFADSSFEILGRLDNSDMRGCNLLII